MESPQLILERLDSIEARLLGLEDGSGTDIDPHTAVHLLFRDFHNLKSSLSMGGADISARLIHQAESCLDALRSGKGDPGSDWIDPLIAVVDHVRKAMETNREVESPELSVRLDGLLEAWSQKGKDQPREIGFPLEGSEAQALNRAVSGGLVPYVLEKLLGEGLDASTVRALPIFEAVAEAGVVLAHRLVKVIGSGAVLTILFGTDKTRDDLMFILFDPFHPVIASAGRPTPGVVEAVPANVKLKRILIVDDEPLALMLLQHFLSPYGRIDTAESGTEALAKFNSALSGKDPYHILFLDIMIPGIPGNAVLEEIRKQEKLAGIAISEGTRIVMASSLADYASISTSFQNQSDAYLVKPLDVQTVDKTMAKFGFTKLAFPFSTVPKSGTCP